MTTGLERVACALCELDAKPPDATLDGKPHWKDYLPEIWTAIMALRDQRRTRYIEISLVGVWMTPPFSVPECRLTQD